MNAISLLKQDHRNVEQLFEQFEQTSDDTKKRELVERITEELSKHSSVEEQAVYPAAREKAKLTDSVLESLEEHHLVKVTLAELEKMLPSADRYAAKVKVLQENVKHHVEEEESTLFPALQDALTADELDDLGATIERLKPMAPTRAHPFSPDEPPGNLIVGPAVGIADKAVQAGKQVVDKALGAIRGNG